MIHHATPSTNIFSNKDDRLRRRDLEPLAAPHVAAGKHIVNPHHVIARFIELRPLLLVQVPRPTLLLGALYPANVVIVPFAAMWARVIRLLGLLLFVENIPFVHMLNCNGFSFFEERGQKQRVI